MCTWGEAPQRDSRKVACLLSTSSPSQKVATGPPLYQRLLGPPALTRVGRCQARAHEEGHLDGCLSSTEMVPATRPLSRSTSCRPPTSGRWTGGAETASRWPAPSTCLDLQLHVPVFLRARGDGPAARHLLLAAEPLQQTQGRCEWQPGGRPPRPAGRQSAHLPGSEPAARLEARAFLRAACEPQTALSAAACARRRSAHQLRRRLVAVPAAPGRGAVLRVPALTGVLLAVEGALPPEVARGARGPVAAWHAAQVVALRAHCSAPGSSPARGRARTPGRCGGLTNSSSCLLASEVSSSGPEAAARSPGRSPGRPSVRCSCRSSLRRCCCSRLSTSWVCASRRCGTGILPVCAARTRPPPHPHAAISGPLAALAAEVDAQATHVQHAFGKAQV